MDFDLNEDQQSLRDVLRDLLDKRADSARVRAVLDSGTGWDADLWNTLADELGLVGLTVPEEVGGAGAGMVELFIVQEQLGRRLAPVPYLAALLASETLLTCGTEDERRAWLPSLCRGEDVATLAIAEHDVPWQVEGTTVVAAESGGAWAVTGRKDHVLAADCATSYLVPARRSDGQVQVFRVTSDQEGVSVRPDESLDPTRPTSTVSFEHATAEPVGEASADVIRALERVALVAGLALAAEQIGGMQRSLDLAVEHAQTRVQFDRPIGGFQGVKHRLADMYVALASTRASVQYAAWCLQTDAEDAKAAVTLARGRAAESFYRVARDAIQVQGGIGCTWEHDAHFYLKRSVTGRVLLGSTGQTRELAAGSIGF